MRRARRDLRVGRAVSQPHRHGAARLRSTSRRSIGRVAAQLDAHGCATTGPLLTPAQCAALAGTYASDAPFRSRIVMARHGFGRGEYKYFAYPLPDLVAELRAALYRAARRHRQSLERGDGDRSRAILAITRATSRAVARPARRNRRRSCCSTAPATTIACTRISTARTSFRCRSRSCCRGRARISPAASSC